MIFILIRKPWFEKGDHVRLQDVQLSYDLYKSQFRRLPVNNLRLYLYANNLGILWRANKQGIDPDYVTGINTPYVYPNPRSLALGLTANF